MRIKPNLISFDTVKSTNTEMKKIIKKNNGKINNLCITAKNQTSAYGRRKTRWVSFNGNIHLSILLKPRCNVDIANQLSYLTAISVRNSLKRIKKDINVKFKWPNDIIFKKKKLGGIIIETSSYINNKVKWVIVGLGLNLVKSPNLKKKISTTSLLEEKIIVDKEEFINTFLYIFFKNYKIWINKGFNFIKKQWLANVYKTNDEILIKYKNSYRKGKLQNLLKNGGIEIKDKNKIINIFYGDQVV